ncbi:MAG: MFS transporter [Pseudomonadota bacterium]
MTLAIPQPPAACPAKLRDKGPTTPLRLALYGLAAANFAVGTGALMLSGLVAEMAADLRVSEALTGQLITVYALVYAIAAPLMSVWTARFDKRRVLVTASLGLLIANAAAALAPNFEMLALARVAAALSAAAITPVAAAAVTAIAPPERLGAALGLVFGGMAVATAVGVPLGALIGTSLGWRSAFVMVAGLAAASTLILALALPRTLHGAPRTLADLTALLRDRPAMIAVSVTALVMTAQFIPFSFISVQFAQAGFNEPSALFLLLLSFGAASVVGNHVCGALSDRFTPMRVLTGVVLALAPALAAVSLIGLSFWLALAIMAVWGFAGVGFNAPQQARLSRLRPEQAAGLLALNASAIYLGTMLGAALGGALMLGLSAAALPWGGAIIAALAAATLYASRSGDEG